MRRRALIPESTSNPEHPKPETPNSFRPRSRNSQRSWSLDSIQPICLRIEAFVVLPLSGAASGGLVLLWLMLQILGMGVSGSVLRISGFKTGCPRAAEVQYHMAQVSTRISSSTVRFVQRAHSGTVVSSGRRTYGTSENCMARNGSIAIQGCKVVHASMLVRF